jgi:hypothetical protein
MFVKNPKNIKTTLKITLKIKTTLKIELLSGL